MLENIVLLIAGFALIIGGGNFVTNGAVAVARRAKLSPMLIGLTVVAFGSSTPDLAVSLMSTLHGKSALAVGNIIGAVVFDMLLVVGIMAAIKPIRLSQSVRRLDLPVMAMGALILLLCSADSLFNKSVKVDMVSRPDAIIMLLVFAVFMLYTAHNSRREPLPQQEVKEEAKAMNPWLAVLAIVGGLGALVGGGELTVGAASTIARKAGMSEALIGLTIVGIGSSLPDIATSLIATFKGENALALGNIVGSCIMDILMVIGTCGAVRPLSLEGIAPVDFITLAAAAVLLTTIGLTVKRFGRTFGLILVLLYITYMGYLIFGRV